SSTACFWLKQNSHNKGNEGYQSGIKSENWERFWEFTGTTLQDYPLPSELPVERGRELDRLAQQLSDCSPSAVSAAQTPSVGVLAEAAQQSNEIRARMMAAQEELDWEVYRLYGLIDDNLTYVGDDLPGIALGERAFEIALARAVQAGEETTAWFTRHGSTPITEIPQHWPAAYRDLVQRRLDLIATDPNIRLLEKPEYKRRWAQESWEKRQERAVRDWLLDRLEDRRFWFDGQGRPQPRTVAHLADEVARDEHLLSVLGVWEGRPDVPVTSSLTRLLADEAVPYLAAYRYKECGLRKRAAWEHTWALQRREDAGETLSAPIPVPPKYTSADFRKASYWHHRGKLDVPKERFILYPDAGRETDSTALLGWAGWGHAQQALALSLILSAREADGWDDERLIPLVAGLAELQPWVDQWHGEIDPIYGVSLAAFCAEQLSARRSQVGRTPAQLAEWRPASAGLTRRLGNGGRRS
ncbi:MAG: BREX-2 system adenine-specific DNA-methyltransferase PglX, partial [Kineosporiaceae bacterium]